MVPVDGTGTASVEAVKAPPVPGMQKPPARVGKRFQDHFVEAPRKKAKKPAVCKRDPLGCGRTARVQTRLSAAATWAARRGLPGVASAAVQALRRLMAMTSSRVP